MCRDEIEQGCQHAGGAYRAGVPGPPRVLPTSGPHDAEWLLSFLGAHAVPGVETWDGTIYSRSMIVDGRPEVLSLAAHPQGVLTLGTPQTDTAAIHLLGLDDDPSCAVAALSDDGLIGASVGRRPGLRAPGSVDHGETLLRTVVGQQVSLASARAVTGRLVAAHGQPLPARVVASGGPTHLFPAVDALAALDPVSLPMPRARGRTLVGVAAALADDPGVVRTDAALLALPGIGPWTVDYTRLRTRRDPDVLLTTDVAVRRQLERLSGDLPVDTSRWAPFRTTALMHLWAGYLDVAAARAPLARVRRAGKVPA